MWDSVNGEAEWSTDFVEMPYKSTSDVAQFQVFLSDESVNSLVGSFLEVSLTSFWIAGDELPTVPGEPAI